MANHGLLEQRLGSVITFYSYKGGVGRTMSLANTAALLATRGFRVLAIDWDLEAPGLHCYFPEGFPIGSPKSGVLQLMQSWLDEKVETLDWRILRVPCLKNGLRLDVIPSGVGIEGYEHGVLNFNWLDFYSRNGGSDFLEQLREQWLKEYDFVLIDSRTGLTDVSGICTIFFPDTVVLVVTANEQSLRGTEYIISKLEPARQRLHYSRAPLTLVPLISRWDGREEQKEADSWLKKIKEQLGPCLVEWYPQNRDPFEPFTLLRIPHVAYFSFGEKLPVLTHNTTDPELPGYYYAKLADVLDALGNPDFDLNELFRPKSRSSSIRRIFISYVRSEMQTYRHVVTESLKKIGIEVVYQEMFTASGADVVETLRDSIASADAMIILLGRSFGASQSNTPNKSYQQYEYETAVQLKKPVFCFIQSDDSPVDIHDYERKDLQDAFIQQVRKEVICYEFRNAHELQMLVAQLDLTPEFKPQNLPVVGSLFRGRDEVLAQLRSSLMNNQHIAAVTSIHGLGGVGKTRIAIEYAKRYAHEYSALLFITADSEQHLKANLASLCGPMVLDLPEQNAREQEVQVAAAIRWLHKHTGWFLIIDNVDTHEAASAVEELLQNLDTGHVVITSRLSQWGEHVQELALDVLTQSAAVEFLMERTAGKRKVSSTDAEEAWALAKELGFLPLALEQASAFIVTDGSSFTEYLRLLRAMDDEVLQWHDARMTKYPRSLATTWQTSFAQLDDDGRHLLKVLCWLAPEPIPLTMLEHLDFIEFETKLNWKKARRELARYSFAKWADDSNTSIIIHRLVLDISKR